MAEETAVPGGRNLYFEGQHRAEDDADTAQRLWLVSERDRLLNAVALAYGYLWHINDAVPMVSPQRAASAARMLLRDTMTHEQRGEAIAKVRTLLEPQN